MSLLGNGITGSVVGGLYPGGGSGAFTPPPSTYPENAQTVTAAAYGPQGGTAKSRVGVGVGSSWVAAAAFGLLVFIWWGLPK